MYETDDVVFGARLLAEYQADEGGPIVASMSSFVC